jgi:hypothetical protein
MLPRQNGALCEVGRAQVRREQRVIREFERRQQPILKLVGRVKLSMATYPRCDFAARKCASTPVRTTHRGYAPRSWQGR